MQLSEQPYLFIEVKNQGFTPGHLYSNQPSLLSNLPHCKYYADLQIVLSVEEITKTFNFLFRLLATRAKEEKRHSAPPH